MIVFGKVSDTNDTLFGDYVAYLDNDRLWAPKELWIDLEDNGKIAITNYTFQAVNWPSDAQKLPYLVADQIVTVVGTTENTVGLIGGDVSISLRGEIVFAGSYEAFVARMQRKLCLANGLLIINMIFIVFMLVVILRTYRNYIKLKRLEM